MWEKTSKLPKEEKEKKYQIREAVSPKGGECNLFNSLNLQKSTAKNKEGRKKLEKMMPVKKALTE